MSVSGKMMNIAIDKISVGEGNVRSREAEKDLDGLKESIRRIGLFLFVSAQNLHPFTCSILHLYMPCIYILHLHIYMFYRGFTCM